VRFVKITRKLVMLLAASALLVGMPAAAATAADILIGVIEGIDCAGRVLAAPNALLPVPAEPLARLWHAATVLREHRGDGHVAALVAAGIDGCEALVLRAGMDLSREMLQPIRGWADADWEQAAARLAGRGWLGADGRVTAAGAAAHRAVEDATDLAAARAVGTPRAGLRGRAAGRPDAGGKSVRGSAPLPQPRRRARPGARCPLTKPGERPPAKPGGALTNLAGATPSARFLARSRRIRRRR